MGDNLIFCSSYSETLKIIEALDNERERWSKIIDETQDENVKMDYEEDLLVMDELIIRFKEEAQKLFGNNISKLAHASRGIPLTQFLENENSEN